MPLVFVAVLSLHKFPRASEIGMTMASRHNQSFRTARSVERSRSQARRVRCLLSANGLLQPRGGFIQPYKRTTAKVVVRAQPGDSQEGISSSPDDTPNTSGKKPRTAASQKAASRTGMETPDMISTQLTRRFGCAPMDCTQRSGYHHECA